MNIWNQKVSEIKNVKLEGSNRTTGGTIERTVGELLADAQDKSGVFGSDNQPVSGEMTVADLTNWHADYNWSIA